MKSEDKKYSQYFETRTRISGEEFICLKDNSPESLKQLIQNIHHEIFFVSFPNDWIYEKISNTFDCLEECENESEFDQAHDEIEVDCYYNQLLDWAKHTFAQTEIVEVENELSGPIHLFKILAFAQQRCIQKIYFPVWRYLNENNG